MKKFLVLSLGLALVIGLGVGGAWADNIVIPDTTYVAAYLAHSPPSPYGGTGLGSYVKSDTVNGHTRAWYDYIGSEYNTYGAVYDPSSTKLYLYTAIPSGPTSESGGGGSSFYETMNANNGQYATIADLFLTSAGTTYAVTLGSSDYANTGVTLGTVYSGSSPVTSLALMAGAGNWAIGGKYDFNNPQDVPVLANSSYSSLGTLGTSGVVWSYGNYSGDSFASALGLPNSTIAQVAINLGQLQSLGFDTSSFSFLWGTGTCGNDAVTGAVPLPGGVLLLGLGLVRLAAYGRRRKNLA